jgi:hypothetical protein
MTCIVSLPGAGLVIQWFGLRDITWTAHCTRKLAFRKYDISKNISKPLHKMMIDTVNELSYCPVEVSTLNWCYAMKSEGYKIKFTTDISKLSQYNIRVLKIL